MFESQNLHLQGNKKGIHEKESQVTSLEIKIFKWFLLVYEYKHCVYKVQFAIIHHGITQTFSYS
jgi:hypothetical protein